MSSTCSLRSKVDKLLAGGKCTNHVRRALIYHHTLVDAIRKRYMSQKSAKQRQMIAKLTLSLLLKKYSLQKHAKKSIGMTVRTSRFLGSTADTLPYSRMNPNSKTQKFTQRVTAFYLRDENSKMTPGKKDSITRFKQKMQKRFLLDTMSQLHKYLSENPFGSMSYTLFCKLRPFWVLPPTLADRDTCACKKHANLQFQADRLLQMEVLDVAEKSIESIASALACDRSSKKCMYSECVACRDSTPSYHTYAVDTAVWWWAWQTGYEEKTNKDGQLVKFKVTKKEKVHGTIQELVSKFTSACQVFRKHVFNIRHQYSIQCELRKRIEATWTECVLHIDFPENSTCAYSNEIQAVHSGGSHTQATMDTGVMYVGNEVISFCTVSDSHRHDPPAIWTYMSPVFEHIRSVYPDVIKVHFVSDGPTTQYRKKPTSTCSAVGCMNKVSRMVAHGTSVKLFYVPESAFQEMDKVVSKHLVPIPCTMTIHQVISSKPFYIICRDLGCTCSESMCCAYFNVKHFRFPLHLECSESDNAQSSRSIEISDKRDVFLRHITAAMQGAVVRCEI